MPLMAKRSLTTLLLLLFGSISLANARPSAGQLAASTAGATSWTWIQDSPVIFCGQLGSLQSCTIGAQQITPTVAGSIWVIDVETPNNVSIASITGGGGTWHLCPNCHAHDPSTGHSVDAAYNLTGNAGTSQGITVNLSGPSGAYFNIDFWEILPPAGATASLDASGSIFDSTCTTCAGVNLGTLTGTDFVMQTPGASAVADRNSVSSSTGPWTVDYNGGAHNLNTTSGAAPTNILPSPGRAPLYISLAFTSTAGVFTPPSYQNQNSIVQFFIHPSNNNTGGVNCNPSCSFTLPQATSSGNLLFVMAADSANTHITSISAGSNTWVIPSGSNTCSVNLASAGSHTLSCAYALSSVAGATTVNVTMSGTAPTGFALWEIASSTGGAWAFDTQGSQVNPGSNSPPGAALNITGANDVIFQGGLVPGGASGVSHFPGTYALHDGVGYIATDNNSEAVLLNSGPVAPTPLWVAVGQATGAFGIAFKTAGGSTLPSPPTNLTAIVH